MSDDFESVEKLNELEQLLRDKLEQNPQVNCLTPISNKNKQNSNQIYEKDNSPSPFENSLNDRECDSQNDNTNLTIQYQYNETYYEKLTPLGKIVAKGDRELLKLQLKLGADLNEKCQQMNSDRPAHVAMRFNKIDILQDLVKYKADLSIKNDQNQTVLHLMALSIFEQNQIDGIFKQQYINESFFKALNMVNRERMTALHISCIKNNYNFVSKLLSQNADTKLKNEDGQLCIDLAQDETIHQLIKNHLKENN